MPQYNCVIIEATDYFPLEILGFDIYDYTFYYLADNNISLEYIKDDFEKRTGLCANKIYIAQTSTNAYKGVIKLDDGSDYIYPCIKINDEETSITGFYIKDI